MPTNEELDAVDAWLRAHPAAAVSREERRAKLATVQVACDELSDSDYVRYMNAWQRAPLDADAREASGALHFLSTRIRRAIDEIRGTQVAKGLAAWHFYNMGYVFKTPDACFGIDLHARGSEALAGTLDFLLITHSHGDHVTPLLLEAMQQRGKPIISNWFDGGRKIAAPETLRFGPVQVDIAIGDHGVNDPARSNDMLLYEIDAGAASGHATIYHIGDNANLERLTPTRAIDLYIFHVAVGLPVEPSIRKVGAKLALASHVLELGHSRFPPHAWRWSYDYAYGQIAKVDPSRAEVPVWGERFEAG
ncbi:MAG: MBL fold metallo-hydrolase [Planctomycetota bacterium]|nr:MBL fold metallo-hydrolase [Planctomycetota bacterium]